MMNMVVVSTVGDPCFLDYIEYRFVYGDNAVVAKGRYVAEALKKAVDKGAYKVNRVEYIHVVPVSLAFAVCPERPGVDREAAKAYKILDGVYKGTVNAVKFSELAELAKKYATMLEPALLDGAVVVVPNSFAFYRARIFVKLSWSEAAADAARAIIAEKVYRAVTDARADMIVFLGFHGPADVIAMTRDAVHTVASISGIEVAEAVGLIEDGGEYTDVVLTRPSVKIRYRGLCSTAVTEPQYTVELEIKRWGDQVLTFKPVGFETFSEAWRRLGLCA
jgi:hypothetical protein